MKLAIFLKMKVYKVSIILIINRLSQKKMKTREKNIEGHSTGQQKKQQKS